VDSAGDPAEGKDGGEAEPDPARDLRVAVGAEGFGLRFSDSELASALLAAHGLAWDELPGATPELRTHRRKSSHLPLVVLLLALGGAWALHDPFSANEAAAIEVLESIQNAQGMALYDPPDRDVDGDGEGEYLDLEGLMQAGNMVFDLGTGTHAGYRFEVRVPAAPDEAELRFEAFAVPIDPGRTGRRSFAVDQDSEVRELGK
jgi:hypothetical protein